MHDIETKVIRKLIRTLKAAGDPIVSVWDGEENIPVTRETDILAAIDTVDECGLYTRSGAWIGIILGNLQDCIFDHDVSLESVFEPVYAYAMTFDN